VTLPLDMGGNAAPIAVAGRGLRHVFVRDLVLPVSIGVYRHEHEALQRVRVNVDLGVTESEDGLEDSLENVVNYEIIAEGVRAIVASGHIRLAETLAECIASLCLKDRRVRLARVRVEKLDVFADAASAGVEIERNNPQGPMPNVQTRL
jgi:dihydroneopterin aldolase